MRVNLFNRWHSNNDTNQRHQRNENNIRNRTETKSHFDSSSSSSMEFYYLLFSVYFDHLAHSVSLHFFPLSPALWSVCIRMPNWFVGLGFARLCGEFLFTKFVILYFMHLRTGDSHIMCNVHVISMDSGTS